MSSPSDRRRRRTPQARRASPGEKRSGRRKPSGIAGEPEAPAAHYKRGEQRRLEVKICGFNACMKLFEHRPEQIIRAYLSERIAARCSSLMKYLAAQKKAYHVLAEEELERVAASTHHEGLCLLVHRTPASEVGEWLARQPADEPFLAVAVIGVSNPHNLGAILRSCAHFGVPAIVSDRAMLLQSGAAVRTAAGGAEFVEILQCEGPRQLFTAAARHRVSIVATSSHGGADLFQAQLPERALLLFGEEGSGLPKRTLQSAELCLQIPGTGAVESLNVSAAAAMILGEFWRRRS